MNNVVNTQLMNRMNVYISHTRSFVRLERIHSKWNHRICSRQSRRTYLDRVVSERVNVYNEDVRSNFLDC